MATTITKLANAGAFAACLVLSAATASASPYAKTRGYKPVKLATYAGGAVAGKHSWDSRKTAGGTLGFSQNARGNWVVKHVYQVKVTKAGKPTLEEHSQTIFFGKAKAHSDGTVTLSKPARQLALFGEQFGTHLALSPDGKGEMRQTAHSGGKFFGFNTGYFDQVTPIQIVNSPSKK